MNFGREGDARHKGKKVISQSCTKVFEFIDGGEWHLILKSDADLAVFEVHKGIWSNFYDWISTLNNKTKTIK